LLAYKSAEAARSNGDLLFSVPLKGCEVRNGSFYRALCVSKLEFLLQVTPAVNLSAGKYELKLEVPSADGMTDMHLRFNSVSWIFFLLIPSPFSCVQG
jgi:hypothetical protein